MTPPPDPAPAVFTRSLFDRLGGREVLFKLVNCFYADVRQHAVIGPIFNARIADWPAHLEKLTDFWSGVTGGPPRYAGGMPWKHVPLGLEEQHFEAWLGLWKNNCRRHLPEREAADMVNAAEKIGQRLRQILTAVAQANGRPDGACRRPA